MMTNMPLSRIHVGLWVQMMALPVFKAGAVGRCNESASNKKKRDEC
jgi:hypothetical protein